VFVALILSVAISTALFIIYRYENKLMLLEQQHTSTTNIVAIVSLLDTFVHIRDFLELHHRS